MHIASPAHDNDDAVAVAQRRASIAFIGFGAVAFAYWVRYPFGLLGLLFLIVLFALARIAVGVVCRAEPRWLNVFLVPCGVAMALPLLKMVLLLH